MRRSGLDPRVWLLWGAAVSVPLLTGRHPLIVLHLAIVVAVVRASCLPPDRARGWGWLLRVALLAVPLGVIFNVLTVRAGDQMLARLPSDLPLIGGGLSWNAVVYGALSGLAIVVLVGAGTTVAAALDWSALMRSLPPRATGVAVAGSVAWAFLPQLATSWREIREAQAARGHQFRGARDAVPLVVPLLAGGLDRSITMAEALEARGFGASAPSSARRSESWLLAGAATLAVLAVYLLAVGSVVASGVATAGTIGTGALALRPHRSPLGTRPTRYRMARWGPSDTAVVVAALVAIGATAAALAIAPATLRYDPYPDLGWPTTAAWLLAALALLLAPAVLAPAAADPEVGA